MPVVNNGFFSVCIDILCMEFLLPDLQIGGAPLLVGQTVMYLVSLESAFKWESCLFHGILNTFWVTVSQFQMWTYIFISGRDPWIWKLAHNFPSWWACRPIIPSDNLKLCAPLIFQEEKKCSYFCKRKCMERNNLVWVIKMNRQMFCNAERYMNHRKYSRLHPKLAGTFWAVGIFGIDSHWYELELVQLQLG